MIDEKHPFPDSVYGDTRTRIVEIKSSDEVSEFFFVVPRRFEIDERYALLLRNGEIELEDLFRELILLGRDPSPDCLWLYKVISFKVKREHLGSRADFDDNRIDSRSVCFDDYQNLAAYLEEKAGGGVKMKMEWETEIPPM